MVRALRQAGIPASVDFEAVGESGEQLVAFFQSDTPAKIGGGSLFRIDNQWVTLSLLLPVVVRIESNDVVDTHYALLSHVPHHSSHTSRRLRYRYRLSLNFRKS